MVVLPASFAAVPDGVPGACPFFSPQNGLRENYNQSKDLLKSEKYSEVNKMIQERANRQVEIDKDAKEDTWYKFTDEANKIQNVVMNTAYGLLNDIASLPRFVNGITGGDKFRIIK
jgi:hypothetical protein